MTSAAEFLDWLLAVDRRGDAWIDADNGRVIIKCPTKWVSHLRPVVDAIGTEALRAELTRRGSTVQAILDQPIRERV